MRQIQWVVMLLAGLLIAAPAWANSDGPRSVIESTVMDIVHVLAERKDVTVLSDADREAIRATVAGHFDYAAMAKRSLGRPWKKINAAEQAHFTELFRELLERSYGNRLSEYKDQKIVFKDAELRGNKARVKSMVIDGTRETPVEYRMHQTDSGWQVYDIRIEGTSMVRTFYQDFKSTLAKGGYPKLLKILEKKIAKLKVNG
ncbi:MAG: ABC transporter substrate-binding protein [Mariprofundus sp.]|nr:ABC transporter substrate-binding protein [Mariprofundus sp.]